MNEINFLHMQINSIVMHYALKMSTRSPNDSLMYVFKSKFNIMLINQYVFNTEIIWKQLCNNTSNRFLYLLFMFQTSS